MVDFYCFSHNPVDLNECFDSQLNFTFAASQGLLHVMHFLEWILGILSFEVIFHLLTLAVKIVNNQGKYIKNDTKT